MSIKGTILGACLRFTKQPKMDRLLTNKRVSVEDTQDRYLGYEVRIDNRHPLYLVSMAILRLYEPNMSKESFYQKVSANKDSIAKEAGIATDSYKGIIHQGMFFSENDQSFIFADEGSYVVTDSLIMRVFDTNISSLSGISPINTNSGISSTTSIVINIYSLSRLLMENYIPNHIVTDEGKIEFVFSLNKMLWRNIVVPMIEDYYNRSVFNIYNHFITGEDLTMSEEVPPFNVLDYDKDLLKGFEARCDGTLHRGILGELSLTDRVTMIDLLMQDIDVVVPTNLRWAELINEFKWAWIMLNIDGTPSDLKPYLKQYIREVRNRNIINNCPHAVLRSMINEYLLAIEGML